MTDHLAPDDTNEDGFYPATLTAFSPAGSVVGGHTKGIVQLLALTAASIVAVVSDGYVSLVELQQLAVLLLGAILVWAIPNTQAGVGAYLKTIVASIVAIVSAVPLAASQGWNLAALEGESYSAWLSALVPVAGTLATFALPNATGGTLSALQGAMEEVEREVLDLPAPEEADVTGARLRAPKADDRTATTSLPVVSATAVPADLSEALAPTRKGRRR